MQQGRGFGDAGAAGLPQDDGRGAGQPTSQATNSVAGSSARGS